MTVLALSMAHYAPTGVWFVHDRDDELPQQCGKRLICLWRSRPCWRRDDTRFSANLAFL